MQLAPRSRGALIALVGVLIVSPDAVFTRLVYAEGISGYQSIFWKYLFVTLLHTASTLCHLGGIRELQQGLKAGPLHIIGGIVTQLAISFCLNLAFKNTIAARALLFFALNPLWAAAFSWLALSDPIAVRTLITLPLALISIFVVFLPSLVPSFAADDSNPSEQGNAATLVGDIYGVSAGAGLGLFITLSRSAKLKAPDAAMIAAPALGSAATVLVTLAWQAAEAGGGGGEAGGEQSGGGGSIGDVSGFVIGVSCANALCVSICYSAMVLAPRYINSTETGLILELELVLGPIWVFAALGEVPSKFTLIGGALLLAVLTGHELAGWRADRKAPGQAARLGQAADATAAGAAAGGACRATMAAAYATCAVEGSVQPATVQLELHERSQCDSVNGSSKG